jgi:hypothetical protein
MASVFSIILEAFSRCWKGATWSSFHLYLKTEIIVVLVQTKGEQATVLESPQITQSCTVELYSGAEETEEVTYDVLAPTVNWSYVSSCRGRY